jgi:hypothetical protein
MSEAENKILSNCGPKDALPALKKPPESSRVRHFVTLG